MDKNVAENGDRHDIPEAVLTTLRSRFPDAAIEKWTRETENDLVIYDIEFSQGGRKFEADITEAGRIQNWEEEIDYGELPEAIKKVVDGKYPESKQIVTMAVNAVVEGTEKLEGYEITLMSSGGAEVELTAAPDGKILEETGGKK